MIFGQPTFERDEYGYAICRVEIEGKQAVLTAEQKPTLWREKIVFIGNNFSDITVNRNGKILEGFTDDKEFFSQVAEPFIEWVNAG